MKLSQVFRAYYATKSFMAQAARVMTFRSRYPKGGKDYDMMSAYTAASTFDRAPARASKAQPAKAVPSAPVTRRKLAPSPRVQRSIPSPTMSYEESMNSEPMPAAQQRLVASVLKPGTWGGEVELNGLAAMLGLNIAVCRVEQLGENDQIVAQVTHTAEAGSKNTIYVAYDGEHYDAINILAHEQDTSGKIKGFIGKVPGDGDCMFHAVAEAANINGTLPVANIFRGGPLTYLRRPGSWLAKLVPDSAHLSDEKIYGRFRQIVADSLRAQLSNHLQLPKYAEMAEIAEIGGF